LEACSIALPRQSQAMHPNDRAGAGYPAQQAAYPEASEEDNRAMEVLRSYQTQRQQLKQELAQLETNLFQMEKHYVQTPKQHGNIFSGAQMPLTACSNTVEACGCNFPCGSLCARQGCC
jgi:chromosome segregation ATPase